MVSGVLVVCRPDHLDETKAAVDALEWAEVHHVQPDGRFVATIEAADAHASIERLGRLQSLPHVILAEMATCYTEQPEESGGTDAPDAA